MHLSFKKRSDNLLIEESPVNMITKTAFNFCENELYQNPDFERLLEEFNLFHMHAGSCTLSVGFMSSAHWII